MDTCDCCGKTMRCARLAPRSPSRLFVCQDCRDAGMKRLGRDGVTALHVSFVVGQ
jgi:ribosome-binding protein aMBF1 (putative translation factor)